MTPISIAIATHNRADELARTLASLGRIDRPQNIRAEILVIANGCSDSTEKVAADAAKSVGLPLRCIQENRLGLSHARNRAIEEAKYEVIAFLDDDVDVDHNWLTAMSAAFDDGQYAAVGGRAYLVFPGPRPDWLHWRDEGFLTKVELGDHPRPAQADELYGLNLSIRRNWLRKIGPFRADLGRVGTNLIGDEECELLSRVVAAGGKLCYEPAAVVGHRVPTSRLKRSWFWRRCFHGNRSTVRAMPESDVHPSALMRAGARAAMAAWRAAKLLPHPKSADFFHETVLLTSQTGRCVGLLNQLLGRSTEPDPPPPKATFSHTTV